MSNGAVERLQVAQGLLDHQFARPELLMEALTHRSAVYGRSGRADGARRGIGSNERLEFMGDRVLGLIVAEWLIERFPAEQEGELGPRHAQLVSRRVLAEIAEQAGLSAALTVGANEKRAGVGSLANVLADAMEAVIGALYLDAGLEQARRFVRAAWGRAMEEMTLPPKDPKTELQEWLMARGLPLPVYVVADRQGPSHAPNFTVSVTVDATGAEQTGQGLAGNKRAAERLAAADLLRQLRA